MTDVWKLILVGSLLTAPAITASAEPAASHELRPPSTVMAAPSARPMRAPHRPLATTERWGGGIRLTGLSGIGALPGVNYGGEVAAMLRRDELFIEIAIGTWKPEKTYVVTETPERVELGLDVWTLRGGWASMETPLRAWALVEVGELASARSMPGVVTRMVMGDVPQARRWQALGAGFGVAWPLSDSARLFGMIEMAAPVNRGEVMLDHVGAYQSDPFVARSSAGLEVGWR